MTTITPLSESEIALRNAHRADATAMNDVELEQAYRHIEGCPMSGRMADDYYYFEAIFREWRKRHERAMLDRCQYAADYPAN